MSKTLFLEIEVYILTQSHFVIAVVVIIIIIINIIFSIIILIA